MIFCLLAIAGFAVQNLGVKEYGKRFPETAYTQLVMLTIATFLVAVIMAALGGIKPLNAQGYLITLLFGAFFVMTIAAMTQSMNSGPLGLTVLVQNSSLLVPVLFGALVWKEALTPLRVIGIVFVLILLALSARTGVDENGSANYDRRKWIFFTGLSFIGNSGLSIFQGLMSRASADTDAITFTFWTSVFSVLVAVAGVIFLRTRGASVRLIGKSAEDGKAAFTLCNLAIGVGTAGGNCFTILALATVPAVVLFPVRMGGLVLLMWALGTILYREKITRTGILMLIIGLIGIVLLNL